MLFQKEEIDMKYLIKVLLLAILIISNVACSRRAPHPTGNGRREIRNVNITQPNRHGENYNEPVNPVTPRSVNKAKPNVEQIKQDLIGHSLSEGVKDGYYPSYWRWTIREGEISSLSIEQVIKDSSSEYEILSNMRLTSRAGKSFNAKVRICYIFNNSEGWHIQFIQSQGMYIVKTGKYDDCVKIEKDGIWYYIVNHCEVALEVGGSELHYYGWEKYSHVLEPHGGYCMYNPDEIIIDYVERP